MNIRLSFIQSAVPIQHNPQVMAGFELTMQVMRTAKGAPNQQRISVDASRRSHGTIDFKSLHIQQSLIRGNHNMRLQRMNSPQSK